MDDGGGELVVDFVCFGWGDFLVYVVVVIGCFVVY